MLNYLTFGGADSRTYNVYISGSGIYNSPARALTMVNIPGRNGALILNEYERFDNIEVVYPAFIFKQFDSKVADFRAVLSRYGYYQRLTDTYHPNEYRMGVFMRGLEVTPTKPLDAGRFDIVFNCKPQRFLTSGETATSFTSSGTITNPTQFSTKPLLRVYGAGTVGIGAGTITISQADVYTDIDCDLCLAYKGSTNKNQYVSFASYGGPSLGPGSNNITLNTGITKVEVTPRWWTL